MTSPVSGPIGRAVTFGEAMIRVTPPFNERLESSTTWTPTVGGTELNVAAGLRILGVRSAWVSALPDNALGRFIARSAAAGRVDTDGIAWVDEDEGRAGLYFLEEGTVPRPSSILYDRKNAAIATVDPARYDWPALLDGAGLLHVTGITLALSPNARRAAMDAMRTANELGRDRLLRPELPLPPVECRRGGGSVPRGDAVCRHPLRFGGRAGDVLRHPR